MKITGTEFQIIDFNIDGVLNLDRKYELLKVANPVEYNTQWQIGIGVPIGFLLIEAEYAQKNKVNLSNLCIYKTHSKYGFLLDNYNNEKEIMEEVANSLYDNMARGYNDKIKGTKLQVPFPSETKEAHNRFCQQTVQSLHKALQRLQYL
jgi:hypothetical protein